MSRLFFLPSIGATSRRIWQVAFVGTVVSIAVVVGGWTDATASQRSNNSASSLTWAVSAAPAGLDITRAVNFDSVTAQYLVNDTLFTLAKNGALVPRLATSYKHPNPTTYVYTIRKGVKFWDGHPMTAEDIAYSLQRQLSKTVGSAYGYALGALKSARVTGPSQVTVKLTRPDPIFKYVATEGWEVVEKSFASNHPKDLGTASVGTMATGPYKIKSWTSAGGIVLTRNESYWGPKPAPKTITIKEVSDPNALRLGVQSGAISGSFDGSVFDARQWLANSKAHVKFASSVALNYLSFDQTQPPFDDVHVRRAIAYALDRNALAKTVAYGHDTPATIMMSAPQATVTYGSGLKKLPSSVPTYPFSLAKAKQELDQSKSASGLSITLSYVGTNSQASLVAQSLQQNLKQIGVTLNLRAVPENQFYNELGGTGQLGLRLIPTGWGSLEPYEALSDTSASTSVDNYARYKSPTIDQKLKQLTTATGAKHTALVTGIVKELADQAVYVPIDWPQTIVVTDSNWSYQDWYPRKADWIWHVKPAQ
jgi:peptide/nickel transport system substrate-binding protein